MPTALTHVVAGVGLGALLAPGPAPVGFHAINAALALLPDADVAAFWFGIPYGSRWGHRGFSHSLFLAALLGGVLAWPLAPLLGFGVLPLWGCWFAVLASHSLLDALTNGGKGVALLAPFDERRYFFPWRPIQVSPIGLAVFSRWGWRALSSEMVWVWLPLGLTLATTAMVRHFS